MPKAAEYASVTINGQEFRNWKSLEFNRSYTDWASHCRLVTSEASESTLLGAAKIRPGDQATLSLAGVKVMDGYVVVRNPTYSADSHSLTIDIMSKMIDPVRSSVEIKGGQFKDYTFEQIAKGVLAPFGINFSWLSGVPDGAANPFPKVNLNFGQTVFDFLESLARMRNVYIRDDENGDAVAHRVTGSEAAAAELVEGRNIKAAAAILADNDAFRTVHVVGQRPGGDAAWGDPARDVSARAENPSAQRYSYTGAHMEHPGNNDDAKMRADRETGELSVTTAEVTIVVQGWLMDSGDLWVSKIGQPMSIKSPMLFPDDFAKLYMRGCTHRQSDGGGTETEMVFCKQEALGGLPQASYGAAPDAFGGNAQPAQPDAPDTSGKYAI